MGVPPSDERREILQPSLLPVPDNSGLGGPTTSDHNCVCDGVRDGAGLAVINNQCYKHNTNLTTAFNTYNASYLSGKPGSWLPSFLINVVDFGRQFLQW